MKTLGEEEAARLRRVVFPPSEGQHSFLSVSEEELLWVLSLWHRQCLQEQQREELLAQDRGNGPCGVLSALQAHMLMMGGGDVLAALESMLWRCATGADGAACVVTAEDSFAVVLPADSAAVWCASSREELRELLHSLGPVLLGEGGLLLLVYSLVMTRGLDLVEKDLRGGLVSQDAPLPTLIVEPVGFSSHSLTALCLWGQALSSGGPSHPVDLGMLSIEEAESNIYTLGPFSKTPRFPIWVLDSGSHLCTCASVNGRPLDTSPAEELESRGGLEYLPPGDSVHHVKVYNGLPPNGPRVYSAQVQLLDPSAGSEAPPQEEDPGAAAPEEGLMVSMIVSRQKDEISGRWLFEVACRPWKKDSAPPPSSPSQEGEQDQQAGDLMQDIHAFEEAVQGGEGEEAMAAQRIFESQLGLLAPGVEHRTEMRGKWRCRDCTLKVPTVWSAFMDAHEPCCRECGKPAQECGACLWVTLNELPLQAQTKAEQLYLSPFVKIMRTAWAGCRLGAGCEEPMVL